MNSAAHGNEDGRQGDEDGRHRNLLPEFRKRALFTLPYSRIPVLFSQIFDSPGV
ncbi:hypothetical protein [uncultured Parabacteroides sp.]|uniref:hypothetical protein n=1 Tax=uncultured Parabacteroides sp. TaxID=512312 RepID=UPI002803AC74|nr:hypothetical protein [uncultured Parabacteroides sp.]